MVSPKSFGPSLFYFGLCHFQSDIENLNDYILAQLNDSQEFLVAVYTGEQPTA